jgi:calcineurin-like phosphoesterase family protein
MLNRSAAIIAAVIGVVSTTITMTVAVSLGVSSASVAPAAITTFTAVADTYVQDTTPTINYGTASQLFVDGSPVDRTFLKFTASGLVDPVTNAKLRIHTDDIKSASSSVGGTLQAVSDTTWSETALVWNNQPALGATLGSVGAVVRNNWYEVDVTSAVTGNGTFSFALSSTNNNNAIYDSRETGATAAQLVVTTGTQSGDPVLVGAGDIADCGNTGDSATAALLDGIPGTVYTLGDNVYPNGTLTEFQNCYDPTWGRHKARTKPAPGNHDYNTSGATGYFTYFGSLAGPSGVGYYSYDVGTWHVVSLNSEVAHGVGSTQEQWLRADLAASAQPCTLAYWHKPRFTSGANHAPDTSMTPLWQALYDFNGDVVLSGHNHQYERFAPQDASGNLDTARGLREFVAGTGGESHYNFATIQPNSEVRNSDAFGVLKLTLHANSYDWQFVPEAGKTFTDTGTGSCH